MDYKNLFIRSLTSSIFIFLIIYSIFQLDGYLILISSAVYLIIFTEILIFFNKRTIQFFISIVYIILSYVCLITYLDYYFNNLEFLYFIFIISIFDISSFFLGSLFGKKKILPIISPNKTFLGFFGGIILAIILSFIFNYYFKIFNFGSFIIFNLLIILSSFLGDIYESYYKRISFIKDSSFFLPGHGGLFDRLDSFLMAIIFYLIFNLLV